MDYKDNHHSNDRHHEKKENIVKLQRQDMVILYKTELSNDGYKSMKNIREKQLAKIKSKLKYSLPRGQFDERYKTSSLKPSIFFFDAFLRVHGLKNKEKKDALLQKLVENQIFIPDTIFKLHNTFQTTRVKYDHQAEKYIIIQDTVTQSNFYNDRRRHMLELMELLHKVDEQGIDDKLNEKPMAIEKHQGHICFKKSDSMIKEQMQDSIEDIILDSNDMEVHEVTDKLKDAAILNIKQALGSRLQQNGCFQTAQSHRKNVMNERPSTQILDQENLRQKAMKDFQNDFLIQEFIRSKNKQGKINFYRVIYESQKLDQSRRRPMKVFNIVQRNSYSENEDFKRESQKLKENLGMGVKDQKYVEQKQKQERVKQMKKEREQRVKKLTKSISPVKTELIVKDLIGENVSLFKSIKKETKSTSLFLDHVRTKFNGESKNEEQLKVQMMKKMVSSKQAENQKIQDKNTSDKPHVAAEEKPKNELSLNTNFWSTPLDKPKSFNIKKFTKDLNMQYMIQLKEMNQCDIFEKNITHLGAQNIEQMIEGLIDFFQAIYSDIRIKQIVVDFLVDVRGVAWLIDVKHIKSIKFVKVGSSLIRKRVLKLRERVTKCFMCKQYKKEEDVQNLYVKRVIYQTKLSLMHRGVYEYCYREHGEETPETITNDQYFKEHKKFESMIILGDSKSECKVCFACKRVIDEEQQLRRCQKQHIDVLSSKCIEKYRVLSVNQENTTYVLRARNQPKLHEFRLAFILRNLIINKEKMMKINNILLEADFFRLDLYLHFVLHNVHDDQKIHLNPNSPVKISQEQIKKNNVKVDKIIIRYLWLKPDCELSIWKFFANTELHIYMTDQPQFNPSGNNNLYQISSGYPFKGFTMQGVGSIQMHEFKYYFFNKFHQEDDCKPTLNKSSKGSSYEVNKDQPAPELQSMQDQETEVLRRHVDNDYLEFIVSLEQSEPNWTPQIETQNDLEIFNDVVYFLKGEKIDFIDPMVPIAENWMQLIIEMYQNTKHQDQQILLAVQASQNFKDQLKVCEKTLRIHSMRNSDFTEDQKQEDSLYQKKQSNQIQDIKLKKFHLVLKQNDMQSARSFLVDDKLLSNRLKEIDNQTSKLLKMDTKLNDMSPTKRIKAQPIKIDPKTYKNLSIDLTNLLDKQTKLINSISPTSKAESKRIQDQYLTAKQTDTISDQKGQILEALQILNRQILESTEEKQNRIARIEEMIQGKKDAELVKNVMWKEFEKNPEKFIVQALFNLIKPYDVNAEKERESKERIRMIDLQMKDLKERENVPFEELCHSDMVFQMACSNAPSVKTVTKTADTIHGPHKLINIDDQTVEKNSPSEATLDTRIQQFNTQSSSKERSKQGTDSMIQLGKPPLMPMSNTQNKFLLTNSFGPFGAQSSSEYNLTDHSLRSQVRPTTAHVKKVQNLKKNKRTQSVIQENNQMIYDEPYTLEESEPETSIPEENSVATALVNQHNNTNKGTFISNDNHHEKQKFISWSTEDLLIFKKRKVSNKQKKKREFAKLHYTLKKQVISTAYKNQKLRPQSCKNTRPQSMQQRHDEFIYVNKISQFNAMPRTVYQPIGMTTEFTNLLTKSKSTKSYQQTKCYGGV